ncbi:acyltransferase [Phocaeicola barnesiae]
MIKYFVSKLFRIPRKLRRLFYMYYNRFLFWLNDVKFGKNMKVIGWIYINKRRGSRIKIGNNFRFYSGDGINPLSRNICGMIHSAFPESSIIIGNNVGISASSLRCKESITIEDNVNIGADCIIMDTDAHNLDYRYRNGSIRGPKGEIIDLITAKSAPIVIEHDVLIGARSMILKGVTIGACSIIGSGSVVTKSIPPHCIAAGNPCKVLKTLDFD